MRERLAPPPWARRARAKSAGGFAWKATRPFGATLRLHHFVHRNGLELFVVPDHAAPVVSYQTWFRVGSRHERPGKTGLAHLFEHLMFKATANRASGEFDRLLEEAGGETNASTWTDWTQYHDNVPKKALGLVVELEADRMANLLLDEAQVRSEKEVVANERRQRVDDDVDGAASEVLYETAFVRHPYRWPTIGSMRDIKSFTVKDCMAFYRTYYAPNNAALVVVGDVDGGDLLERVDAAYGGMRRAKLPAERAAREPAQRRARRKTLRLPTPSPRITIAVAAPAFGDRAHAALNVAHEIAFGGRASRLYQRLVVEQQLVTDVGGFIAPFRDPGLWEVGATARPGKRIDEVEAVLVEEVERLGREPVTAEELERAKNRTELSFLGAMETASGKAEQIGFYGTVTGDPCGAFARLRDYQSVTAKDVMRAAAEAFRPERRTTLLVAPKRGRR